MSVLYIYVYSFNIVFIDGSKCIYSYISLHVCTYPCISVHSLCASSLSPVRRPGAELSPYLRAHHWALTWIFKRTVFRESHQPHRPMTFIRERF